MDTYAFLLEGVRNSWRSMGRPGRILAAVSGGADSVALLHLLHALAGEENLSLFAAHVDHGLRENSGEDAAFTQNLCGGLGVPCKIFRVYIEGQSENAARDARYAALYAAAAENKCPCIALAHHRRDQAETLLLHLIRGGGAAGLSGMEAGRRMENGMLLWRPLLALSPDDLRGFLMEKGILWREDDTNASDQYLRNYLRHQILPRLEKRAPAAEKALSRAAVLFQRDEDYLHHQAAAFLRDNANLALPCPFILREPLRSLHPALGSRAVRAAFPGTLDFETTEALLRLEKGGQMNLPGNWKAMASATRLHFIPPNDEKLPFGIIRALPYTGEKGRGIRSQAMPRAVWEKAALSHRRPGDSIHPLGGPGSKSLQDYFVDKKIDRPFRDHIPLLRIGERIIWAIGVGPGEEVRVKAGEDAVLLQYEGYLPGELPGGSMAIKE